MHAMRMVEVNIALLQYTALSVIIALVYVCV